MVDFLFRNRLDELSVDFVLFLLSGEVVRPIRSLQADVNVDALAADQQGRVRHDEPRRLAHQTSRTGTLS